MPGWWFTIESTTTRHFIHQLKTAVENALKSDPRVRAVMRARATKQRFPVSQWVEDLEKLQSSAIDISHKQAARERRPIFDSPNTSTILETPGLLSVLQSSVTASLRPRSALVQASNHRRSLTTISEVPRHSWTTQASHQAKHLRSLSEGRTFVESGSGLGSKIGPGSRRRAPPPLLLSGSSNAATRPDLHAIRGPGDEEPTNSQPRAPVPRSPSSPNLRTGPDLNEQETTEIPATPERRRSLTMPQLRPADRKAVRLMGTQLSASRASELTSPQQSSSSSDEIASHTPSTPGTPVTPGSAYYTPPLTPTPPPSRMSRGQVSFQTNSTAATSVSGANSTGHNNRNSSATSISAAKTSDAASETGVGKTSVIHSPHAVDSFPSLGPHYFPHGGIAVLSTSDVKEERPNNISQNLVPFFSDPDKEYESKFKKEMKRLNGKNSEHDLCIEEYLLKSEKSWFAKLRAAELNKASKSSHPEEQSSETLTQGTNQERAREDTFGSGANRKLPTGLKRILRLKIGDWPVYSFLLAFVREVDPCFQ